MTQVGSVTAALLVVGDEILSGRTKDQNIGYIADYLTKIGIDLREARIVPENITLLPKSASKAKSAMPRSRTVVPATMAPMPTDAIANCRVTSTLMNQAAGSVTVSSMANAVAAPTTGTSQT